MDCESWLLSKPAKSSPKVGFYIFFKWVGGKLALALSLDGGKLVLSYKGFFSFFFLKKLKIKKRERHKRVFSLHLKSSIKPGMHLLIALRVVSELNSYPDSLAGWCGMLFHFCDYFLPCVCVCVCACVCVSVCLCVQSLSRVRLFAIPWTIAHQGPLSMEFSRQEYWRDLSCSPLGIFLTQGSNPSILCLLCWQANFYHWATWEAPSFLVQWGK